MNKENIVATKDAVDTLLQVARSPEQIENKGIVESILKTEAASIPVLVALGVERHKFNDSNKKAMQWLIDILVESGIYPKITPVMEKHNYTHLSMVESWGENWYLWGDPHNCPHCDADLCNRETGPPFKRELGVEISSLYDGTLFYRCPDCDKGVSIRGNKLSDEEVSNPNTETLMK
jgi:hypothetical protein